MAGPWEWAACSAMGAGTSTVDMAVLPEHQRRGVGDAILGALLERIHHEAPAGAYVNLIADAPGRRLHARHGFLPTAPESIGMARFLD
jgi:GNAT superfamily N-acetyltransferase